MSVITISRGSFSGGKALAECLAGCLDFRCIDRDVIVERAAAHGISQEELREALEKPPRLLQRFSHKKYVYLALIQAALTEEVRTGRAVYHGNAGHLLLRGGPHILRTRIIAPLDSRVRVAQERLKISRAEALAYIQRMDQMPARPSPPPSASAASSSPPSARRPWRTSPSPAAPAPFSPSSPPPRISSSTSAPAAP